MKYELTFLTKEGSELKNVKELIEFYKGEVTKENKWGEKTLAYPIKNSNTAFYFEFEFEMDKKNVLELKNKLNLDEKILRYLLLVRE